MGGRCLVLEMRVGWGYGLLRVLLRVGTNFNRVMIG